MTSVAPAVTPYKNSSGKKEQVRSMFNKIAHRYDLLNTVLSAGIHKSWRRKAVRMIAGIKPLQVLDVATGTGDFAIEALKLKPTKVTGIDISEGMLELGKKKIAEKKLEDKIELLLADSEKLPFGDNSFDACTIGFGVRNFEDLEKGLSEICRVLRPGGMICVLEFSKPRRFPVKQFYASYCRFILPAIGRLFSGDKAAYTYLPESVRAFPDGQDFLAILEKTGFERTNCRPLSFGIASIYTGTKQ